MNQYIQIIFSDLQAEVKEILIAQLADAGFEGFEETENGLNAFIKKDEYDKFLLEKISDACQTKFSENTIDDINWNQLWESNFQPVVVNNFGSRTPWVGIRADFHEPINNVQHEIIITPKMSFGTGHHATTCMMIEQMQEIDFTNKTVIDFGTGTGILAILAQKLGAQKTVAIDNDDWCIENANENISRNNSRNILIKKASDILAENKSDIILANINKQFILENFTSLSMQLNEAGVLLISGILDEDKEEILKAAIDCGLIFQKELIRNNWICLKFVS